MNQETKTPSSVLALCRELDVKIICLRFTDFLGKERVARIPFSELKDEAFEYGFGLNPSGIPCLGARGNADVLLVPQPDTSFFDPFSPIPTLNLLCGIQDPITREDLKTDSRSIAIKAMAYFASCGFADKAQVGAELEFHLLASDNDIRQVLTHIDSEPIQIDPLEHSATISDEEHERLVLGNGYLERRQDESHRHLPADCEDDINGLIYADIIKHLTACRVQIDGQRLRCSAGSWTTIGIRSEDPVHAADAIVVARYIIRNLARRYRRKAVFLPKIDASIRGCGMPIHTSFLRGGEALLAGSEFGGLSATGIGAVGGLVKHLASLCALVSPSTNSYRRLSDSAREDTPAFKTYSRGLQAAAIRVPEFSSSPRNKRIEFACPDSTSNPYISISATLMAMLDGAQNKTDPGATPDQLTQESHPMMTFDRVPQSLEEALSSLEIDHDYLTRGGVFVPEIVEAWIKCKRMLEVGRLRRIPHPGELDVSGDY